ncbi:Eco57I restriction-modification methylase domain-containing protein [Micromonospora sp. NPDC047527]|uniref:Eco57I restriction-modification methylase domain-containing protein n=1 Tax=Micromonospora sp. NPDC047527 TaxID=3155144 RepID=UPI00340F2284
MGANENERSQLAALGGVAAAIARRSNPDMDFSSFPHHVQRWLLSAPQPSPDLVDALCLDLDGKSDPLALIYERIVSGPRRRRLGTFFTPAAVLDYISELVKDLPKAPRVVADPGAGVGAFSAAALQWWKKAEVHAVDVNLVTLGLLATRPGVAQHGGSREATRLKIRHEDFLEWLTTRWGELDGPRLILGNPPYTRHQLLTSSEKEAAQAAAGELSPGARAGLSTYFLAAALASLAPVDSLCLLLPANWLEADYARSVRKRIWESSRRDVQLHLFPNDLNVFPSAQVAAMVIFVGPQRRTAQTLKVYNVTGSLEEGFRRGALGEITRNGPVPASFSPKRLLSTSRASRGVSVKSTVPLASVAVVRRGVATGANTFFLRTSEEMGLLPAGSCVPAISRLRSLEGDILDAASHGKLGEDGVRCWLLDLDEDKAQDPALKELIASAEEQRIHEGHLCSKRKPWYALEKIIAPDILVGPMGKDRFRIVVNQIFAVPTNTLYGLRLRRRSGESSVRAGIETLAAWLRSDDGQLAMRASARNHHGDGLVKLEPGALGLVEIPQDLLVN